MSALFGLSAILFIAALPIILVFVFLELNAEKQAETEGGPKINDGQRKLAKFIGWGLFTILVLFLIIGAFNAEEHHNFRGLVKIIIGAVLHFLL